MDGFCRFFFYYTDSCYALNHNTDTVDAGITFCYDHANKWSISLFFIVYFAIGEIALNQIRGTRYRHKFKNNEPFAMANSMNIILRCARNPNNKVTNNTLRMVGDNN